MLVRADGARHGEAPDALLMIKGRIRGCPAVRLSGCHRVFPSGRGACVGDRQEQRDQDGAEDQYDGRAAAVEGERGAGVSWTVGRTASELSRPPAGSLRSG